MVGRYWLTFVNLALVAAALAVYFVAPAYSEIAFYGLLIWMFGSLFFAYRWAGRSASARAGPAGSPIPGGAAPLPASEHLGFCIWCGTTVDAHARVCPACGRGLGA